MATALSQLHLEDYAQGYNLLPCQQMWQEISKLRPADRSTGMVSVSLAFRLKHRGKYYTATADRLADFDFVPVADTQVLVLTEEQPLFNRDNRGFIARVRGWQYDSGRRIFGGTGASRIVNWDLSFPPRQHHQPANQVKHLGAIRAQKQGQVTVHQYADWVDVCVGFFDGDPLCQDRPVIEYRFALEDVVSGRIELVYPFVPGQSAEYGDVQVGDLLAQAKTATHRLAAVLEQGKPIFDCPPPPVPSAIRDSLLTPALDMYEQQLRVAFHGHQLSGSLGELPLRTFVETSEEELLRLMSADNAEFTRELSRDLLSAVGPNGLLTSDPITGERGLFRLHARARLAHLNRQDGRSVSAKVLSVSAYDQDLTRILYDDGSSQFVPSSCRLFVYSADGLETVPLAPGMQVLDDDVIGDYVPRLRYASLQSLAEAVGPAFYDVVLQFLLQNAVQSDRVWAARAGKHMLVPAAYVPNLQDLAVPLEYLNLGAIRHYQTETGYFLLPPAKYDPTNEVIPVGELSAVNDDWPTHHKERRRAFTR